MLKPNPAFEQFRRRIKETLFRPWKGTIYRVTTLKYRAILLGEGSYRNGGRWNAIESFRAVYGSTDAVVALAESEVNAKYANLPYPFRETRLVVAVDVELTRVVNLTMGETLETFGVTDEELRREDWRKVQEQGFESFTQALGRAVFAAKGEGLVTRSARVENGINVAYFPENKHRDSKARLWEAQQLRDFGLE
jgi:RES domain-containing protein